MRNKRKRPARFLKRRKPSHAEDVFRFWKTGEGGFVGELDVRHHHANNKTTWELLAPIVFVSKTGYFAIIEKGFTTDLASVPRIFWPIVPPFGRYSRAAVLHDYLLQENLVSIETANEMFFEALETLNTNKTTRFLIKTGVRGYFFFKRLLFKLPFLPPYGV